MALIDRVKERTGTDLSDTELQAMIDAITLDIEARFGPAGPITIELGDFEDPQSRSLRTLRLARPMDQTLPVTIVEVDPGNTGVAADELTLALGDYRVAHGGRTLQRLTGGPNGRSYWAPLVRVTYTPAGDRAARDEATIKIMQLDLSYRGGLKSERAGDYQFTLAGDVSVEREKIFETLAIRRGMALA
ncbi:head-to-tail adaptor [Sinorhizobium phage StopSmel]|nr:head-to-tail adaptor [Sinorhizobium phage StopSmel]